MTGQSRGNRVLVTGGSGFTGSHLVHSLVEDGHEVTVLTRSADSARENPILPEDARFVEGDVADPESVRQAVDGQNQIFHLAAAFREPGLPDSRYYDVHVKGTELVLRAAREQGVQRVVHCSTVGVHSHIENPPADESEPHKPGDIYQETKSEGERLALDFQQRHDFPLTVVRPAPIYGPGDLRLLKMFRMIDRGVFVILGDGTPYFHMVHVEDLVYGMRLMAESQEAIGEVFILAGEECPTLNELTAKIADLLDARRPRLHLPARPFQILGDVCERICIPLGITPPIFRRRVDFFTKSRAFSIEKARSMLGYEPRIDLETGLRQTIDWYRQHGHLS